MRFHPRSINSALGLILVAGCPAFADSVSASQAEAAARQWLRVGSPLLKASPQKVGTVRTHYSDSGQALLHEVSLASGGFVVMAPDDELEPVVAFSEQGSLDLSPGNPLWAMLQTDLQGRLAHVEHEHKRLATQRLQNPTGSLSPQQSHWRDLLSSAVESQDYLASLPAVTDLRVAPLVQSKWNQSGASGKPLYNYYTPNQYPDGCVATAMAQLMRFYSFPTAGIGAKSFTISVDSASQSATTRGGDGIGGPYNWSQMPYASSTTMLDSERQMIGALCYDAGLSVNMSYAASGSGSSMSTASQALVKTFGYANSICGSTGGELTGHGLLEMVQPNLDAGFPVLFGISGTGGHAIVCDGYGFAGSPSVLYHHLNLGWGGNSDAWYNLPDIGTGYKFDLINACVYNVYSTGKGDILSGRITDASGAPLAGVQVSNGSVSATTNANGIYALVHLTPGLETITATKSGAKFPQAMRMIAATSANGPTVGNLPNVDLVQDGGAIPVIFPQPKSQETLAGGNLTFTAGATGMGPLHFQWLKNNQAVGTDSPTYVLNAISASDDQSAIQVRVTGAQGSATSNAAKVSVVYLINGGFETGSSGWNLTGGAAKQGTLYSLVSPHSGEGWARLGDHASSQTDAISQTISIPASATQAPLSFWMGIGNDGASATTVTNTLSLKIMDASGSKLLDTLQTRDNTQAELDANGLVVWHAYGPFDLTKYAGQTITVRFESVQPGTQGSGTMFTLDDVTLPVTFGSTSTHATASVTPAAWTLATGGSATFGASVVGSKADNRVNWSVSGSAGLFSAVQTTGDGKATTTFTAGSTPGIYSIAATPVESGGVAGSSVLTVVAPASVTVGLTGSATSVAPNDSVTFTAKVIPLSDSSVIWSCSGGTFSAQGGTTSTWSSATPGTYTITAASTGAPSRSAVANVTVNPPAALLSIAPVATVLLPGASAMFTATGDQGSGVTWTIPTPLLHVDTGLTTSVSAPAAAVLATKVFTVSASSKQDATKTASALITVKGMDVNADGVLDPSDLLGLAAEWGKGVNSPANFKGNGVVDDTDLNALLNQMK
jgi:hypothetical protein